MEFLLSYKRLIYRILSVLGFFFLALSLCVHILTIFEVNIGEMIPAVWLLHVAILGTVVPLAILPRIEDPDEPAEEKDLNLPKWLYVIFGAAIIYVAINFLVFGVGAKGQPAIVDGKYVLQEHGKIVKELDKEGYERAQAQQLRGFSGHWIFFSLAAATVGGVMARKKENQN